MATSMLRRWAREEIQRVRTARRVAVEARPVELPQRTVPDDDWTYEPVFFGLFYRRRRTVNSAMAQLIRGL